eukprot:scaffold12456_cov36-Tisochrysis_lutea.AAC.2
MAGDVCALSANKEPLRARMSSHMAVRHTVAPWHPWQCSKPPSCTSLHQDIASLENTELWVEHGGQRKERRWLDRGRRDVADVAHFA